MNGQDSDHPFGSRKVPVLDFSKFEFKGRNIGTPQPTVPSYSYLGLSRSRSDGWALLLAFSMHDGQLLEA